MKDASENCVELIIQFLKGYRKIYQHGGTISTIFTTKDWTKLYQDCKDVVDKLKFGKPLESKPAFRIVENILPKRSKKLVEKQKPIESKFTIEDWFNLLSTAFRVYLKQEVLTALALDEQLDAWISRWKKESTMLKHSIILVSAPASPLISYLKGLKDSDRTLFDVLNNVYREICILPFREKFTQFILQTLDNIRNFNYSSEICSKLSGTDKISHINFELQEVVSLLHNFRFVWQEALSYSSNLREYWTKYFQTIDENHQDPVLKSFQLETILTSELSLLEPFSRIGVLRSKVLEVFDAESILTWFQKSLLQLFGNPNCITFAVSLRSLISLVPEWDSIVSRLIDPFKCFHILHVLVWDQLLLPHMQLDSKMALEQCNETCSKVCFLFEYSSSFSDVFKKWKTEVKFKEFWKNCLKQYQGSWSFARLLNLYLDREISLGETKQLKTIISIASHLEDLDEFIVVYKKKLAIRLMKSMSKKDYTQCEEECISTIRTILGETHIYRISGMFHDCSDATLNNLETRFKAFLQNHSPWMGNQSFEMKPITLSNAFWDINSSMKIELNLPNAMKKPFEQFTNFYTKDFKPHSKLDWCHTLGFVTVSSYFTNSKTPYTLVMTPMHAALMFTLYERDGSMVWNELAQQLFPRLLEEIKYDLSLETLRQAIFFVVKSFAFGTYRIIQVVRNGKRVLTDPDALLEQDRITILDSIETKRKKIPKKIQFSLQNKLKHEQTENVQDIQDLARSRGFLIEAAIIRLMKQHKKLSWNNLQVFLKKELKFPFEFKTVKAKLESLIERQFLARGEMENEIVYVS